MLFLFLALTIFPLQIFSSHNINLKRQLKLHHLVFQESDVHQNTPVNMSLSFTRKKPANILTRSSIIHGDQRYTCVPHDFQRLRLALQGVGRWAEWAHDAINNREDRYGQEAFNRVFLTPNREDRRDISARFLAVMREVRDPENGSVQVLCDYEGERCHGRFEGSYVARLLAGCNFYIV